MKDLITEARELCERATPGPWGSRIDVGKTYYVFTPSYGVRDFCCLSGGFEHEADAAFIARSRTLVEELCDALERANAAVAWIPVAERLPACEKGAEAGPILYRMKTTGTVEVGYFGRNGRQRDSYFRHLRDSQDGVDSDDVTHWMPLPAAEGRR